MKTVIVFLLVFVGGCAYNPPGYSDWDKVVPLQPGIEYQGGEWDPSQLPGTYDQRVDEAVRNAYISFLGVSEKTSYETNFGWHAPQLIQSGVYAGLYTGNCVTYTIHVASYLKPLGIPVTVAIGERLYFGRTNAAGLQDWEWHWSKHAWVVLPDGRYVDHSRSDPFHDNGKYKIIWTTQI